MRGGRMRDGRMRDGRMMNGRRTDAPLGHGQAVRAKTASLQKETSVQARPVHSGPISRETVPQVPLEADPTHGLTVRVQTASDRLLHVEKDRANLRSENVRMAESRFQGRVLLGLAKEKADPREVAAPGHAAKSDCALKDKSERADTATQNR